MRYQRDGFSIEAAIRKGRDLPGWFVDEPPQGPHDDFYIDSFWDLSSTRRFEHGPIPWDTIVEYGRHKGLAPDIIDMFVTLIRAMDVGVLGWTAQQAERERE